MSTPSPFDAQLAQIPVTKHTAVINNTEVAYWEYGDTSKPLDVVMIHGFRGDHHGLEPFVAQLGPEFHVIIPDLPGFGLSQEFNQPSNMDAYSQWLIYFWAFCQPSQNTAVLGHSFGSIIVSAAVAQGLKTDKVVLINPIAANALTGPRSFMTKLAVAYYKLSAALPERMGNALLKNSLIVRVMSSTMAKTREKSLRKWIHAQHDEYFSVFASRSSLLEAFQASVSHDVSEYIPGVTQQVLMIVAEKDDITALPEQKKLVKKLQHGKMHVIADVGHLVHYEAPDQAARAMAPFIREAN